MGCENGKCSVGGAVDSEPKETPEAALRRYLQLHAELADAKEVLDALRIAYAFPSTGCDDRLRKVGAVFAGRIADSAEGLAALPSGNPLPPVAPPVTRTRK